MGEGRFYARKKSKEIINPPISPFRKGGHLKKKKFYSPRPLMVEGDLKIKNY